MPELTPEQQEEMKGRVQAFVAEFNEFYAALKEKHQCQLVYGVVTVPGPQGIHGLTVSESVQDTKYAPVPSPFVATENASAD
jgi:hypothetical protein